MDIQKEMTYLMTLLGIVFMIVAGGILINIGRYSASADAAIQAQMFMLYLCIGVLFLKDGIFGFLNGIQDILKGKDAFE